MLKRDYTDEERFKILIDYLINWITNEYKTLGENINIADSVLFNLCGVLNLSSLKSEQGLKYLNDLLSEHHFEKINIRFLWLSAELELFLDPEYREKVKSVFDKTFVYDANRKVVIKNNKILLKVYNKYPWIWILHILQIAHSNMLKEGELKIVTPNT